MKILVTGGAGFIASNIVDALIDIGHNVVIVDNLTSGFQQNLNPKAKFYKIDIRDSKLSEILEREKPQIVNHHAAQIDVRKSSEDPIADATEEDGKHAAFDGIKNDHTGGIILAHVLVK